jgi:hypothetical protein
MKVSFTKANFDTIKADSVIVFTFSDENLLNTTAEKLDKFLGGQLKTAISAGDLKGRRRKFLFFIRLIQILRGIASYLLVLEKGKR